MFEVKSLLLNRILFQMILFPIFKVIITKQIDFKYIKGEKEQSESSKDYTFHKNSEDLSSWLYKYITEIVTQQDYTKDSVSCYS